MRTVIHIGSDKTGTTSLQARFASCRVQLEAHGIVYPDLDGRPDHLGLAESRLAVPATDAGSDVLILSSEAFWPLGPDRIAALLDQLPRGPVDIVAYLREPGSFAEAAFLQRCRMCSSERELFAVVKLLFVPAQINPIVRRAILRLHQLRHWLDNDRGAAATVRPYTPAQWIDGDILEDFCTTADIAHSIPILEASPAQTQNRTLNLDAIHASVLVRERFGIGAQTAFLGALQDHDGELRPAGMYTSSRLRAHLRKRAKPLLAELDQRFPGLAASLTPSDRVQIPSTLNRHRARDLAATITFGID